MNASRICKPLFLTTTLFLSGCGLLDDGATKKSSNSGLIATPVTYYSTSRARYLGAKYKENLDRLVERIVRNPKTANLQFANNIASVGGIGFFTHSATKTADERYLEVVLAAPETFETKGSHSDKLNRLFSVYGLDLLTIVSGDNDIYQDKELTGYGLNLSWRNVIADPTGNRVSLERAIVYVSKESTRSYLRRDIDQNGLLADATIFAVEEDGPLNLISYRAPEVLQEYRPGIREDDIAPAPAKPLQSPPAVKVDKPDQEKKDARPLTEPVAKVAPPKPPVAVAQKTKPLPPKAPLVESRSTDVARIEVSESVTTLVAETKANTPLVNPALTSPEPVPAVTDTPKLVVSSMAPPPLPVVEVEQSAAAAPVPKTEPMAPPTIQAKGFESAASERVVAAPKPTVVEPGPFLSTNVPGAEAGNLAKAQPSIANPDVHGVAIVSRPPVGEPIAPSPQSIAAPYSVPAPAVAKSRPIPIETPLTPPLTTRNAQVEPKRVEIISAAPAPVKALSEPVPDGALQSAPIQSATRSAPPVMEAPARPLAAAAPPVFEKTPAKATAEQLASLVSRPPDSMPIKPAVARPAAPKALEGFIIQLAFNDKERAQRWAEGMEKKGFAISITEAGAEGALRVRLGNFVLRDDAERQLKTLKQEGLTGIILNLPQAFRPEARTSIP